MLAEVESRLSSRGPKDRLSQSIRDGASRVMTGRPSETFTFAGLSLGYFIQSFVGSEGKCEHDVPLEIGNDHDRQGQAGWAAGCCPTGDA